jgi:uncharacterized membrane protein YciS (DUF1049 family)
MEKEYMSTQGTVQAPGLLGILVIVGIVAGLLLLVLLLVLVSMWAQRRQKLARFEAERRAAQHDAELGVQKLQRSKATVNIQQPVTELSCPNCRYQLSPAAPGARPTIDTLPTAELPISEKAPASPVTSQSRQALIKETVLDDQAIRATLQRLWNRAGR